MPAPVYQSNGQATGAATDTVTIPAPSGIANNDILIAVVYAEPQTQTISPPAGWSSVVSGTNTGYPFKLQIFWKRANSESGSYVFTETGNSWGTGTIFRVSGCITTETPIGAVGTMASGNSINPAATGITTLTNNALLLFITANGDGFGMDLAPGGMTERYDADNDYLATEDRATAGATGDKTATLDASNQWVAVLIELKSEAAAGGGTTLTPGTGTLTLTGQTPIRLENSIRQPATGTLTLTGRTPTLNSGMVIPTPVGTLTLTGYAPTLAQAGALSISVPKGQLTLEGTYPDLVFGPGPATGTLTLTGTVPTLRYATIPPTGALTLTGAAPGVFQAIVRQPATGTLTLTGYAPTLQTPTNLVISPATRALALTGYAPTISVFTGVIQVPTGTLTLTGYPPGIEEDGGAHIDNPGGANSSSYRWRSRYRDVSKRREIIA